MTLPSLRRPTVLLAGAALFTTPMAAAAHPDHPAEPAYEGHGDGPYDGEWIGEWQDGDHYEGEWRGTYHGDADAYGGRWTERDAWLAECRRRYDQSFGGRRDGRREVGGALVGGAIGGIAGNRIAGRGNRTVGTVVGAAVGAAAGAAVASESQRDGYYESDGYDYCESYLAQHEASYRGGYSHGYGYAVPVVMVPMQMGHQHNSGCRTIVTTEEIWEDVPVAQRSISPPAKRTVSKSVKAQRYVKSAPATKYVKGK